MSIRTRFGWRAGAAALFAALLLASAPLGPSAAQGRDVVVFAAASLKNALDEIATAWTRESGGKKATIAYAASSALAKQIEQGAPADLFASADLDWMDYAQSKGLVRPDTRVNLLGNRLVLIAAEDGRRVSPGLRAPSP
jgi:molybdate transport system substrate-binding protein